MRKKLYAENEIIISEISASGNAINHIIKCKYLELIDHSV